MRFLRDVTMSISPLRSGTFCTRCGMDALYLNALFL